MENAFRSRRLVFRALESPEDDAYFMESQQDYAGLANSTRGLLLPSSKKSVEEYKNYLQEKCLLAVVVCLPAPAVHEAANNDAQVKHAKEDGKSKSEVLLQARPIPIGIIALSKPPEHMAHHRWADIGLTFLPAYQGMGYGSESIEWILQWGFQIAGLHRIGIAGASYNPRALALYERLGFIPEARRREDIWFNGEWHDSVELAMIDYEWRARRDAKKLAEVKQSIVTSP